MLEVSVHCHLAVHRRLAFLRLDLDIGAIRQHDPGVDGIPQLQVQNAVELLGNGRVVNADAHLHAALGVAGQEVARGNIDMPALPFPEAVNAGVFQIAAHQAADVDILRLARHACPHAADAAHDHIHPDTGTAGFADLGNDLGVVDGVVFQDHGRRQAVLGTGDLAVHLVHQHRLEAQGRHQHGVSLAGQALQCHVVEHGAGFLANLLIGGDEGQVGIELAGLFVVVAGTDLGEVAVFAVHLAGDKGQLGMDLVIVKTVEHGAARVLQLFGPVNVVLLVKAGTQLHHGHDLFAVFRRSDQRLDDLGVVGHTVQGHLDGDDVGVGARTHQHTDEGADALVRVGNEHVPVLGFLIQVVGGRCLDGLCRRIEQLLTAVRRHTGGQAVHAAQVQRRYLGQAAVGGDHQFFPQELDDVLRCIRPELQTDRRQLAALFQQFAHDVAEVDVMVHHALVHGDVRIAGHAEQAGFLHRALAEHHGRKMGDEFLYKGKVGFVFLTHEEDPLKLAVDGDDAVMYAVVFADQLHDIVGPLVAQEGERMALVHDLRAEDREDLVLEIAFPGMLLTFFQVGKVDLVVAVLCQLIQQVQIIFVALGLQFRHLGHDGRQLLRGGHVGHVVQLVVLEQRLVIQRPHAHHEELIQVAAEDGLKFETLPQRHGLILGQCQHAAVEVQPAEFAIDKNRIH